MNCALVTGASRGIGRAIAERFAKEGAKVLIAEIEEIGGKKTERFINNNGGHALYHNTDMSNEDSIKEMISSICSVHLGENDGKLIFNDL